MKTTILGLLAAGLLAGPMAANAVTVTVTVGGEKWNVTSQTGTFSSLSDTLDDQVWWDDQNLASQFSMTLGGSLGYPNSYPSENLSPLFAIAGNSVAFSAYSWGDQQSPTVLTSSVEKTFVFAVATRVPEPGTLALLGLGLAGLGLSRRRKAA